MCKHSTDVKHSAKSIQIYVEFKELTRKVMQIFHSSKKLYISNTVMKERRLHGMIRLLTTYRDKAFMLPVCQTYRYVLQPLCASR